tara:strand:- start:123 stop:257 length:135 start_codon:yes stop_codon:yes gene_type:complete
MAKLLENSNNYSSKNNMLMQNRQLFSALELNKNFPGFKESFRVI